MVTDVRRDRCPTGGGSKGQGQGGQRKASINPAAAASAVRGLLLARQCKSRMAFGTTGRSGGPFHLSCHVASARRAKHFALSEVISAYVKPFRQKYFAS